MRQQLNVFPAAAPQRQSAECDAEHAECSWLWNHVNLDIVYCGALTNVKSKVCRGPCIGSADGNRRPASADRTPG